MSIFSRSKPKRVNDPVFGELTLSRHGWEGGNIPSPASIGTIWVRVSRTEEAPNEADRAAISAFLQCYPSLISALKGALFQLWEPYVEESLWEEPWPTSADALWNMLTLEGVTVLSSGAVDLLYAFKGDVWPDAMFSVQVKETNVVPISLDD